MLHARRAVEQAPDNWDYRGTLALVDYRLGNYRSSRASLEKCVRLPGRDHSYDWLMLTMTVWQLGCQSEARECYTKALVSLGQDNPTNLDLILLCNEAAELLGEPRRYASQFVRTGTETVRELPDCVFAP